MQGGAGAGWGGADSRWSKMRAARLPAASTTSGLSLPWSQVMAGRLGFRWVLQSLHPVLVKDNIDRLYSLMFRQYLYFHRQQGKPS